MARAKKSKPAPRAARRRGVICPGCSTELALHGMVSDSDAFVYASKTDMHKLGINCKNDACILCIEGVIDADKKAPVNPIIRRCVQSAEKQRAAIKAASKEKRKEEKKQEKKRKEEHEAVEYARYNPFSGSREEEIKNAIQERKRQRKETKKTLKRWKGIKKHADELDQLIPLFEE
ncbi:hypothetical protein J7T55_015498 [Diaporthe amygdali]|uniref:uncharacterized protein n=1 Tax=Phomopsis amygdali TaxID=1214568 RepID=UPI0022FEFA3E|nr:uncharacterized protein J7T55_015498 [Diaporthe amygdali]KAJ0120765.1 hypothetical protein J7T55_015498 [Diaporthe amygdali]